MAVQIMEKRETKQSREKCWGKGLGEGRKGGERRVDGGRERKGSKF